VIARKLKEQVSPINKRQVDKAEWYSCALVV
jgi:hypothetical protein